MVSINLMQLISELEYKKYIIIKIYINFTFSVNKIVISQPINYLIKTYCNL